VVIESDAERASRYRNSAEHIRIDAQSIANANEREVLHRLAADFEALADEVQRAPISPKPGKQTAL
jgi:hypothetical protein